jgi:hypothetical protein
MIYIYTIALLATGFGLASPWIASEVPSFRWWTIWRAVGCAGLLAAFWISTRMMDAPGIGAVLNGVGLFWLQMLAAMVFIVSFAAKAYALHKED